MLWLLLLCGVTLLIAATFALAGIWWVLPFAGLEVALLGWAFSRIATGDSDFESLDMDGGTWCYRASRHGEGVEAGGALSWLQVEERRDRGRLVVGLRYAGRQYEVGSFLPEDQKAGLARELAGVIRFAR